MKRRPGHLYHLAVAVLLPLLPGLLPIPARADEAVVRIHPTAGELPANHLKFYVHFPEPMRQGEFLDHCRLSEFPSDEEVAEPFRETELWSDDGLRLTLWLHPGRQKEGVNLNVELGPVLEAGKTYRLTISGKWRTARGRPLGQHMMVVFRAGPRAAGQLDLAAWNLRPPRAGTREPLALSFPAPLDHALLGRMLRIFAGGEEVRGRIEIPRGERGWRFVPEKNWEGKPHRLVVDSLLEDLAGNSFARPFEVDLRGPPPREVPREQSLAFHPTST